MRFVKLGAALAGAVSLAGCLPLTQSPLSVSSGAPQDSRNVLYGSAEPGRTPAVSYTRLRDATAGTAPPVRSAEFSARRTNRVSDAQTQSGDADVVYSEQWYQRERAAEDRLTQTTRICRGC